MGKHRKIAVSDKINNLEVLTLFHKRVPPGKNRRFGSFKCYCGNTFIASTSSVLDGQTKSCGCYQKERTRESHTIHGFTKSRFYRTWINMKQRCYNTKHKSYKDYGGKGITICNQWVSSFSNFYNDMYASYQEDLTIERIDYTKGYFPENCKWATMTEQNRNKSTNIRIQYNGEQVSLEKYCKIIGIKYKTAENYRLNYKKTGKMWGDKLLYSGLI